MIPFFVGIVSCLGVFFRSCYHAYPVDATSATPVSFAFRQSARRTIERAVSDVPRRRYVHRSTVTRL